MKVMFPGTFPILDVVTRKPVEPGVPIRIEFTPVLCDRPIAIDAREVTMTLSDAWPRRVEAPISESGQ